MQHRTSLAQAKGGGVATRGSHVQFKHAEKSGRVTVPHPKRDIPIGTLESIEKQADLKLR
ncbi:type II toxin-antitoxin system HicA family toxin [Agrobacterium sp. ES01]|uniref:type II toxin-antitoxin system HicA family toxin n=1 Tax=Agrobacterium sp. ES01 TaxID=3420714 RepID=UPI003D119939